LSRNYILINFIGYNLRNKETSYDSRICEYKEDYKHEFLVNLLSSSTIETGTYLLIKNVLFSSSYNITAVDFLLFIPKSFIFEVIFDFCHYSSHRILHTNKFLYINIHKKHHKFSYPIPILTFYQDPLDLIITNSIPQFISLIVFPHISLFQFNIILTYKSFIEISGHTSKKLYPNGSFSQFIWLPRFLNISLYTEDHTAHHVNNNCNYSKRFSLWDKVFGTYVESYDIANK
jgi:sphinganine C4-monooxygenase